MGGTLFILGMALMMFCLIGIFVSNIWFQLAISTFAVILYGFYLIYDTQLIMGGKQHALSMDDYILGALMLYIDIITLFLELLQIVAILFGKN